MKITNVKTGKYKVKTINSDFLVREIYLQPAFSPLEKSKYSFLWIEKSGFTTFQAEEKICKFFKISIEGINCQGLKDEDAITQQITSIKKIINDKEAQEFNNRHTKGRDYIKINAILGYGKAPVIERNLHGNCFEITVRNLNKQLSEKICDYCAKKRSISFINYYDKQRFGMAGGPYNTHLIGGAIIKKNINEALKELSKTKNARDIKGFGHMVTKKVNFSDFISAIGLKKISFFIDSYNSMLWNERTLKTISRGNQCAKEKFEGVGILYLPKSGNFIAPQKILSKSYALNFSTLEIKEKIKERSLTVQTTIYVSGFGRDKIYKGKYYITLSFFLPTGCYATMFIDQLIALAKNENDKE
jgi:tRNA pseudouridine13 synthase